MGPTKSLTFLRGTLRVAMYKYHLLIARISYTFSREVLGKKPTPSTKKKDPPSKNAESEDQIPQIRKKTNQKTSNIPFTNIPSTKPFLNIFTLQKHPPQRSLQPNHPPLSHNFDCQVATSQLARCCGQRLGWSQL